MSSAKNNAFIVFHPSVKPFGLSPIVSIIVRAHLVVRRIKPSIRQNGKPLKCQNGIEWQRTNQQTRQKKKWWSGNFSSHYIGKFLACNLFALINECKAWVKRDPDFDTESRLGYVIFVSGNAKKEVNTWSHNFSPTDWLWEVSMP